jgi:hypothetical protein
VGVCQCNLEFRSIVDMPASNVWHNKLPILLLLSHGTAGIEQCWNPKKVYEISSIFKSSKASAWLGLLIEAIDGKALRESTEPSSAP